MGEKGEIMRKVYLFCISYKLVVDQGTLYRYFHSLKEKQTIKSWGPCGIINLAEFLTWAHVCTKICRQYALYCQKGMEVKTRANYRDIMNIVIKKVREVEGLI